jgi:hypothetical protein
LFVDEGHVAMASSVVNASSGSGREPEDQRIEPVLPMVVVIVLTALVGVATGGRLTNLASFRVRHWYLLVAAVAAQVGAALGNGTIRFALVAACCTAVAVWCVLNSRDRSTPAARGLGLIGVGVALNTLVIGLNGGMPVSSAALRVAGLPPTLNVTKGHLDRHVAMTAATKLSWLGDHIGVPHARGVLSPGDLVMLAGIAIAVFFGLRTVDPGERLVVPLEAAAS